MSASVSSFTQNRWWTVIAALLALFMLGSPFALQLNLVDSGPTWLGLDDSARATLNYAWIHRWAWGTDIVYTYGPLSFLSTRLGWGVSRSTFLLLDVLIAANFFFLFRSFLQSARQKGMAVVVLILATLVTPVFYGSGLAWVFLIFLFYWLHRASSRPHWRYFAAAAIVIGLAFFIKLNTGLFALIFLAGYLAAGLLERRISWRTALQAVGMSAGIIGAGALAFRVSLRAYVQGAVEVMKGYNDLMYLMQDHPEEEGRILLLFFILAGAAGVAALLALRRRRWTTAAVLAMSVAYLFFLKKQATFRNDEQHLYEFFAYAPLLLLWGGLPLGRRSDHWVLGSTAVVFGACLVLSFGPRPLPLLWQRVKDRAAVVWDYPAGFVKHDPAKHASQPGKRIIPAQVLQRIGSATTDVFPWDSEYALQNSLRYHPRPCFQTFQANSDYLQRINYDFYREHGPQRVIYDYDAIDGCYPMNDAPVLNLFLLRAYTLADTFSSNGRWRLVLSRKAVATPVVLAPAGKAEVALNRDFPVGDAAFLKLAVHYTARGKLKAFWDKPAALQIVMTLADGRQMRHKTSAELLKSGLVADRYIEDTRAFVQYGLDKTALPAIISIRLEGEAKNIEERLGVEIFAVR